MKTSKLLLVTLFFTAALYSCKKNKKTDTITTPPDISGLEVGHDNNKMAHPGKDLHIEADVKAPEIIANIRLEITPKSGKGWKFDNSYTEGFEGKKSADFHKHIKVPADAAVGDYKLTLTVTDKVGKTAKIESDLKIAVDETAPSVSDLKVENLEVEYEKAENEIHVEANIKAPNKIAKVIVKIQNQKEYEYTDKEMVGTTSYKFHKHISTAGIPDGHYDVFLKVIDQTGNFIEVKDHLDKK